MPDIAQPPPPPFPEGEGRCVVRVGCHPFARRSIVWPERDRDARGNQFDRRGSHREIRYHCRPLGSPAQNRGGAMKASAPFWSFVLLVAIASAAFAQSYPTK